MKLSELLLPRNPILKMVISWHFPRWKCLIWIDFPIIFPGFLGWTCGNCSWVLNAASRKLVPWAAGRNHCWAWFTASHLVGLAMRDQRSKQRCWLFGPGATNTVQWQQHPPLGTDVVRCGLPRTTRSKQFSFYEPWSKSRCWCSYTIGVDHTIFDRGPWSPLEVIRVLHIGGMTTIHISTMACS